MIEDTRDANYLLERKQSFLDWIRDAQKFLANGPDKLTAEAKFGSPTDYGRLSQKLFIQIDKQTYQAALLSGIRDANEEIARIREKLAKLIAE